jgi:hypothetical protein
MRLSLSFVSAREAGWGAKADATARVETKAAMTFIVIVFWGKVTTSALGCQSGRTGRFS